MFDRNDLWFVGVVLAVAGIACVVMLWHPLPGVALVAAGLAMMWRANH
jgi:hypothetical protein